MAKAHRGCKKAIAPEHWAEELDCKQPRITSVWELPSFHGIHGLSRDICASINEQVVHGIPGPVALKEGDIVSVDIGAFFNGYCGDAAKTHPVGKVSPDALRLIETA